MDYEVRDADSKPERFRIEEAKQTREGRRKLIDMRGYVRPSKSADPHGVPYQDREFIAWDTEGGDAGEGEPQPVILFGNSKGTQLTSTDLGTEEMLKAISESGTHYPYAIHISFAFAYDVNQLLKDLRPRYLQELKETGSTCWKHYKINVLWRKWLRVTDFENRRPNGNAVTVCIFDLFTFYNSSFVSAVESVLGADDHRLQKVREGKQARSAFTFADLDLYVIPYWKLELELLVSLAEQMRENLLGVNLEVTGWYGPGAVASAVLKRHRIKEVLSRELPEGVSSAAQFAYYGGRFEQFRTGIKRGGLYSYDIRSAYPDALRTMPDISAGEWRRNTAIHQTGGPYRDFSLYQVRYRAPGITASTLHVPHPFPFRERNGTVSYPLRTWTWLWGCELNAALEHFAQYIEVVDAWEFIPDHDVKPFKFIETMYRDRARLKREGNGSQLALKLAMNSVYGKLAQRVGWDPVNNAPPRWHQLEYAGYITAYCRAKILRAIMQNPLSVISIETDGLFTDSPLDLDEGSDLGQWESECFDRLMYVQSGVYFTGDGESWQKARTRGFNRGSVDAATAFDSVATLSPLRSSVHRFTGMTSFRQCWNMPGWRSWTDADHVAVWGGGGKRFHSPNACPGCARGEDWHWTILSEPFGGISSPHALPWRQEIGCEWQEENPFREDSHGSLADVDLSSQIVL